MIARLIVALMAAFFIILFAGACIWEISLSLERHSRAAKIQDAKTELRVAKLNAQKRAVENSYVRSKSKKNPKIKKAR